MKRTLVVLVVALAILFVPNLHALTYAALGSSGSDALKHVWSQWFVHEQILSGQGLSLHTELLNFPEGGPFFSLDTVNAITGLPLRAIADPVLTYNMILMACIAAAAVAGALLTRTISDDPWVPALGGIGFAFSSWTLCFPLASGVSETAVMWPVPLIVLCGIHAWKNTGWKAPIGGGLLLALQGLACWSHGITAGLLLLGLFIAAHINSDENEWKNHPRLRRLMAMLGMALLCSAPLYLAISGTVSADDAVKARNLSVFHSAPVGPLAVPEANSMALADFFSPGEWGRRVSSSGTEKLQYAAYPGYILMGLGVLAIRRRTPWARTLCVGIVLMALMSMGPRIYLDHARTVGGIPNPVYLLAYWTIPLVNATIHSVDRFAVGLQLCLAALAAFGLTLVKKKLRPWVVAGVVAEVLVVSPGPWPVPMVTASAHPASIYIATHTNQGAVLDLPFQRAGSGKSWFYGDIFLQQTIHGRPIPFQLEGHGIETASPRFAENTFFRNLSSSMMFGHPVVNDCTGANQIAELGVSWIVWHRENTPIGIRDDIDRLLHSCLGSSTAFDTRNVFELQVKP